MPNDPSPPSLLITPDKRRRLQQQYDEARRLGGLPRPDFRRIHELIGGCVTADPGNRLYLDALLANHKRWQDAEGRQRGWWRRIGAWFGHRSLKKYAELSAPYFAGRAPNLPQTAAISLLQDAPGLVRLRSKDVEVFHQLAVAAAVLEFEEVELRYLTAARELSPDDVTTLRLLARALTRQGRFEDAVGPWFAVLALSPGDREAEQAVDDLRGSDSAAPSTGASGPEAAADGQTLRAQAEASRRVGQLDDAEHLFAQAQSALGGDLALYEVRENLRLEKSAKRVEMARLRAEHDEHPKAQSLVASFAAEHDRLEIEILNLRAERLPADWRVRLALARRLKGAGNFSGAVQRLSEALQQAPSEASILIELGECWQHLRQFARALEYYADATRLALADEKGRETILLARYRAGVLAAAMGKPDTARTHFEAIVELEPDYKDVAARRAALVASGSS